MHIEPPFGVIVVNYKSHGLIDENLSEVAADLELARVVIVDNLSSQEERSAMRAICEERDWALIELPNVGFGTAANRGVEHAVTLGCDAFVILNPDAIAPAGVIQALAAQTRSEHQSIVCPRIVSAGGAHWFAGGRLNLRTGRTSTSLGGDTEGMEPWLTGACMALHKSLWLTLGGFDDDYFLYWEDIDLSWRCRQLGGELIVRTDLEVEHNVGGTQQSSGKSDQYYFYNCRNRLIFAEKHLSLSRRLRWALGSAEYARRVLLRGGRRNLLRRPVPPIWAVLRGTWQGLLFRSV